MSSRTGIVAIASLATISALALGACSSPQGGESTEAEEQSITFWTPQTTPDRVAVQEKVAAQFTEETSITVQVVPMGAADQNQAIVTGAAAGDVPDIVLATADQVAAWNNEGLVDTAAAAKTVEAIGADTFTPAAMDFITLDGTVAAVPTDGWSHVIVYRTDLFEKYGIEVPTSLKEVADAAETLASNGVTGIALGTQAGTLSSSEAVESMLQANGCELFVDGEVAFDSPKCVEGLEQFKRLKDSSLAGEFDVPAAQAAYLNGDAGMLLFSTHILDELAGFDPNTPVTCSECGTDSLFLANNSGFITEVDPQNPAQYGSVLNYTIPNGANSEAAQKFIEYSLNDGYLESLGMATEGRIPVRMGATAESDEFITGWGDLSFGVANTDKQSISDVYGADTVAAIRDGVSGVKRWGYGTDDAALAGAVFNQGVISSHLEDLYAGQSASEIATAVTEEVTALQGEYGTK